MSIEDEKHCPDNHYFNRPLSTAKSVEQAPQPDPFGKSKASPRIIKETIFRQNGNSRPQVYYVDENGVRPYEEIDFAPFPRKQKENQDHVASRQAGNFRSLRRQNKDHREYINSPRGRR